MDGDYLISDDCESKNESDYDSDENILREEVQSLQQGTEGNSTNHDSEIKGDSQEENAEGFYIFKIMFSANIFLLLQWVFLR